MLESSRVIRPAISATASTTARLSRQDAADLAGDPWVRRAADEVLQPRHRSVCARQQAALDAPPRWRRQPVPGLLQGTGLLAAAPDRTDGHCRAEHDAADEEPQEHSGQPQLTSEHRPREPAAHGRDKPRPWVTELVAC